MAVRVCTFPECGRLRRSSALWCEGHRAQVRDGRTMAPIRIFDRYAPCAFPECSNVQVTKGICYGHYQQIRQGKPLAPLRSRRCPDCPHPRKSPCGFDGCGKKANVHGLCPGHARQRQLNQPLKPLAFRTREGTVSLVEQKRRNAHRRLAKKNSVEALAVTPREWQRLVDRYGGLCAYCRERPWAERDHIIPLSRGGRYSIGNLLPACVRCNRSKGTRLLVEWRAFKKVEMTCRPL